MIDGILDELRREINESDNPRDMIPRISDTFTFLSAVLGVDAELSPAKYCHIVKYIATDMTKSIQHLGDDHADTYDCKQDIIERFDVSESAAHLAVTEASLLFLAALRQAILDDA